ncbi:PREDICTED: RNA polymerase II transcriptional coactivator KELP-like [Ipomoea nil]|uniref:RNA polymerase II transcriptional coactivator KELP-like n=1 Tax=Ipomoea nil TaxID=35883 RepID=UPI000901B794|nr:PREDICTED: RNA polymerase II transcriptional coactivator KELP-like [Ipomoea nil]
MDAETVVRQITKITTTVLELLKSSNKDVNEIRESASKELRMDLSEPSRRTFVSSLLELYLVELQAKEEAEAEAEKAEKRPEYDDSDDLVIRRLSSTRKVTITKYKRQRMISIREYYKKANGKELPSEKGITLTIESWACLKENFPVIDDAIKEMQSRLN